jgi:hypothetical protein
MRVCVRVCVCVHVIERAIATPTTSKSVSGRLSLLTLKSPWCVPGGKGRKSATQQLGLMLVQTVCRHSCQHYVVRTVDCQRQDIVDGLDGTGSDHGCVQAEEGREG